MSFSSKSLYKQTSQFNNIRGYLGKPYLPKDPETDQEFTITLQYENKPGLLAYDLYGSARYNWIFAYYNRDSIHDALVDMKAGLTITVPSPERVKNL